MSYLLRMNFQQIVSAGNFEGIGPNFEPQFGEDVFPKAETSRSVAPSSRAKFVLTKGGCAGVKRVSPLNSDFFVQKMLKLFPPPLHLDFVLFCLRSFCDTS